MEPEELGSLPPSGFPLNDDLFSNGSIPTNTSTSSQSEISTYYFYESVQFPVMWLIFIFIVLGNSSLLAALLCTTARKSRMNFFIMHLAIADLSVGLFYVFPDIVQKFTIAWLVGDFLCRFLKFLQGVVMYASAYVLVALSIDRCDAITNPMNFSRSWIRAKCLIASAWVISMIFSIPLAVFFEVRNIEGVPQCWIELETPLRWQVWMILIFMEILFLPALVIGACYAIIVFTIWNNSKSVDMSPAINSSRCTTTLRNGTPQTDSDPDSRRASSRGLIPRAKVKSVKMTFVIVFVFVLCWAPYIVFNLLQVYGHIPRTQTAVAVATFVQSLAPLNSVANPLICWMFSPHIYKGLRRLPPYRWLWCAARGRGARSHGTLRSRSDSTAHSDLLSSTRTRRPTSTGAMLNSSRNGSVSWSSDGARRTQLLLASAAHD